MTAIVDLTHTRGDTFSRTISLASGNVSSFDEAWFTVRSEFPDDDVTDETDALSSGTMTGTEIIPTGTKEWTVTINSPNWPVGRLVYDFQVRSSAGEIFTTTKGKLRVFDDVTRST